MSQAAIFFAKLATSKKGRNIIIAIVAFILACMLLLCLGAGTLLSVFAVLGQGDKLYYPLINSTKIAEDFDPDRIIVHTYEVEVEKERPVLDKFGFPKRDEDGNIIKEKYTEIETRTEEIESPHMGVDFEARAGSYVVASSGGTVTSVYFDETEGNVVEMYHSELHYKTRYLHLDMVLVSAGDELIMGQPIGKIGLSGECTPYRDSKENLHFEVEDDNGKIDPSSVLHKWDKQYRDIPALLIKDIAGNEWADWMESEIDPDNITWNGENYLWPLPGHSYISSGFGYRDLDEDGELDDFHSGLDIPAASGTPIYAAAPGIVSTKAHWSYGTCVKVSVDSQTINIYGHMSARAEGITDGVMVQAGDLLGYVGNTGNVTGFHLHFEVDVAGSATDPIPYFG